MVEIQVSDSTIEHNGMNPDEQGRGSLIRKINWNSQLFGVKKNMEMFNVQQPRKTIIESIIVISTRRKTLWADTGEWNVILRIDDKDECITSNVGKKQVEK